jgi:hypothetical protein
MTILDSATARGRVIDTGGFGGNLLRLIGFGILGSRCTPANVKW